MIPRLAGSAEETATFAYAARAYIEGMGGGLQDLARQVEMKQKAGEPTFDLLLRFGEQAIHTQKLAAFAMKSDLYQGQDIFTRRFLGSGAVERSQSRRGLSPKQRQLEQIDVQTGPLKRAKEDLNSGDPDRIARGKRTLEDQARLVRDQKSPLKAANLAINEATYGDLLWTIGINGMLSSPATWVVNWTNVAYAVARPIFQYLPAKAWATMTGDEDAAKAAFEATVMLSQTKQAFMEGAQLAWHAITKEDPLQVLGRDAGADIKDLVRTGGTRSSEIKAMIDRTTDKTRFHDFTEGNETMWDMIDRAGSWVRLPSRIMVGTDKWTRHITIRQEIARQALNRATKDTNLIDIAGDKNLLQDAITRENNMAFNLDAPDFRNKWEFDMAYEHYAAIKDEADYVTFQQDNFLSEGIGGILRKAPFLRPFMPFVRTPTNILSQGIADSTPVGFFMKSYGLLAEEGFNPWKGIKRVQEAMIAKKAQDPGMYYRYMGQVAFGSTMLGVIYAGVTSGEITGGGPHRWMGGNEEWDAQKAWEGSMRAQGREAYSVKTPIGNMKFDRFPEPFAIMLRMVADVAEYSSYMSEAEQDASMATLSMIAASGLYNASFMTGLNNFMEAMTDDNDAGTKKLKMTQGYLETYTPFGGLLKWMGQVTNANPYKTQTARGVDYLNSDGAFALIEDFWGTGPGARMAARIPGFAGNPVQVDQISGEPIPNYPGMGPQGLNPLFITVPVLPRGVEGDKVWEEVFAIRGKFNEQSVSNIKLNPYEQANFNREMGKVTIGGRTLRQAIMDFSQRGYVQEHKANKMAQRRRAGGVGNKTRVESEFDEIVQRYGDAAERVFLSKNPNAQQRWRLKKLIIQQTKLGDVQAARAGQEEMDRLEAISRQNKGEPTAPALPVALPLRY